MKTQIIIGLAFGDEGKGATTDRLCRAADRPLVIRFSGGHQAGHTVIDTDPLTGRERRHVFSNFGAGTLAGAPTFWSRHCTFHPVGYANEREALLDLGAEPELIVDGRAPVTTPYDILYNRNLEEKQKHGSCGLGFGATVQRHAGPHKLHVMDLLYDFVLEQKLASVAAYYEKMGVKYRKDPLAKLLAEFHDAVHYLRRNLRIMDARTFFAGATDHYGTVIFEGSQGLLLDEEFGYFPHVTRAHVSSRNALALIAENGLPAPEIFYITRAYQTRHGNGPLSNECFPGPDLHPTLYETNVYNPWQGHQRRSILDLDQLRYALAADAHYTAGLPRRLVVTCMDQLKRYWKATDGGVPLVLHSEDDLARRVGLTAALQDYKMPRNCLPKTAAVVG